MRVNLKGSGQCWNMPMWYGWPTAGSGYTDAHQMIPNSWGGDARDGGCYIDSHVMLSCHSNAIRFESPGDTREFKFDLLITPFKDLNSVIKSRFGIRHYQLGYPTSSDDTQPDEIQAKFGSTVIGLHQGTSINPFISWIFDPDTSRNMSEYIQKAHNRSMRVKVYFTVRELSVRSALSELFGVSFLDGEILAPRLSFPDPWEHRDNLGNAWLQQHLLNTPNVSEPGYSVAYNLEMPWNPQGFDWDFAVHVKGVFATVEHCDALLELTMYH